MDFKQFLQNDVDTFQMYHGGKEWYYIPKDIIPSRKNRYEYGVGIYTTNNYSRASEYAKGSRIVQILDISKNYNDIKNVKIPLQEVIEFLKSIRIKNRNQIIQDLNFNAQRMKSDFISADTVNNLIVNHEAGAGETGVEITRFLVQHGVDALLERKSGEEYYLIIFNPKIIRRVQKVNPKQIPSFMLPTPPQGNIL
jgi:hypothetical protein